MYQVYLHSVVAVLLLGGAMSEQSIHCKSGWQGASMEVAENGTLTNCQEKEVLRYGSMKVLKFKVNRTLLKSKIPCPKKAIKIGFQYH